jgi:hypothetical protein
VPQKNARQLATAFLYKKKLKNILIPNVVEKNILILVEEKKIMVGPLTYVLQLFAGLSKT